MEDVIIVVRERDAGDKGEIVSYVDALSPIKRGDGSPHALVASHAYYDRA